MFLSFAAALLFAAAAASALRVALGAGGRRLLRHEPALLAAAVVGGAAATAVAAWAVVAAPVAAGVAAAMVALGWGALAWRARPGFGRRRGRPPGSLALADSLAALVDRDFYLRRFARFGPVFKMAQFHQPTVCVAGLARGRELLQRHAAALAPPPLPLSAEIPRGFLRYMAPADHERYARLFRAAFCERTLTGNRDAVAAGARAFLAAWAEGGAQRPPVDRFLLPALARIFFGSLLAPADLAIVEQCGRDATFATATGRPTPKAKAALARFVALLAERRDGGHQPARDLSVWAELAAREPASLADPTVLGNLFLLLEASRDSIGGLLSWSAKRLGEHPHWQARLRAELDAGVAERDSGAPPDLFTCFAFETLRLAQSEYLYRRTLAPIDVDGFTIPRGWLVRICVAESHRQAPPFAEPERFDPDRHRRRRFGPNELSPFGLDQHACLGARLTLFLSRLFLEELVAGYDLTLVADGPPERAPRHWVHWAPSHHLRLALSPREPAAGDPDRLPA